MSENGFVNLLITSQLAIESPLRKRPNYFSFDSSVRDYSLFKPLIILRRYYELKIWWVIRISECVFIQITQYEEKANPEKKKQPGK